MYSVRHQLSLSTTYGRNSACTWLSISESLKYCVCSVSNLLDFTFSPGVVWAFFREGLSRLSNNPAERSRVEELKGLISGDKKAEKKHEQPVSHS